MGEFVIDPNFLISQVEQRPVLWDKSAEGYKDRQLTNAAWKEIFINIKPDYEKYSEQDKTDIGRAITKKWNNIRDHFIKTLKRMEEEKRMGIKKRKKYMYHNKLLFLQRVTQKKIEAKQEILKFREMQMQSVDRYVMDLQKRPSATHNIPIQGIKKEDNWESSDNSRMMYFFRGIAPTVEQFSDDDIVDFQFEVMKLIKQIQSKNQMHNFYPPPGSYGEQSMDDLEPSTSDNMSLVNDNMSLVKCELLSTSSGDESTSGRFEI